MRHTSGLKRRGNSRAGRCSKECCGSSTWLSRRVLVSGPKGSAISVSLHSTLATTLRRWRGVEATKNDLQPESFELDEHEIAPEATSQIERLDPTQLAIWISAAPDPQRTALALFYLEEFDYRQILELADLKLSELSRFLAKGRRQLQAWLDAKFPQLHDV